MFKKLFITIATLGVFSSSAFAWSETFNASTPGSPYNAFQFIVQNGVSVSFKSSATADGWQVVSSKPYGGSYTVINAMGPDEGEVSGIKFSGPGSESNAHFVLQKWYITSTSETLKRNYLFDKDYSFGDYGVSGNSGWYFRVLPDHYYDDWHGPDSTPSGPHNSVSDGGLTLVLLGLALFAMVFYNRFFSRSH